MQQQELAEMDNSFELDNHVRCFNHTLQLSAKALLRPFNPALGKASDIDLNGDQDDLGAEDEDNDGDEDNRSDALDVYDVDDDDIDELDQLNASERKKLMENVGAIRTTVSKLRRLSFSIIQSPTSALPAWRRRCKEFDLKSRIFPRDVVTRWNSTFDMLSFALEYRAVIDAMTADKNLKFRAFKLEDEEWLIVKDLVNVLRVITRCLSPIDGINALA